MKLTDLTLAPSTDPAALYAWRDGLYADDLIIVALAHLDLFTWLSQQGGATEADIARHFGLSSRMTDVLVTLCRARGLLQREGERLQVTLVAKEHFTANSPWFLGPYYASLKDRPSVLHLLEVMRGGSPIFWGGAQSGKTDWHTAMQDDEYAERFTAAMDCRGVYLAQAAAKAVDLAPYRQMLDIAGGSGIYACSFVAHHPHLRAAVLEQPPVDEVARRLIQRRGFADRVEAVTGDLFTPPLPGGFDVHLWSNVLHDWDVPEVRWLIQASFDALPAGGLFIMHDVFLNEAKDGPPAAAAYSVTLAHATQGRCYGTGEIRTWLEEAGFTGFHYQDTVAGRGVATARKP